MQTSMLTRALLFIAGIVAILALITWGVGLETIKARQVDLIYLGQQHLILVFSSMFFALLVGIPSGIALSRPAARGVAEYVMQIFNVGNTLPPLAVLALAMVVIGIGDIPAIIALFLASLLPIVRNTYAGLCSVPASLIEAANGIGMTKWQRLRQVELPNALPVILSGVRIATAINVGTAPLAFLIGASSYGELIFPGIYLNDFPTLILGAAATALFALILDTLLAALGRLLSPHTA
ncbi:MULTISPECIES: osmoprotectant ABC transporter permease OsmY [Kosakonia]|jgi:osmoprotectant transport system permease protein|uniref:Binding--dependent transport system inner membrane component family protein n=1 Tax=Enterobacter cloacae S611 TaxID=1399146 RepID=A0ABN0Q4A4_ENTCL|nr:MULTISPECIES: osmoprotectant ABC transporter permease OsmY [Kosakonia]ESS56754.1 binding--dependent transport system inner membrane component family protein [Enterobacter cloacae S611]MBS5772609.1 osmoprotectant ABC transporter permease OsmY [Enterobacter cloacae]AZI87777.1 osmoprotectant ABC transporter permease OsmY [Kosakonia sp. CCTCC M2018092]MDH2910956.1 osmoprotectant ABC transporter permease OsmY [Kosakonia sp. HypNH10]QAR46418.1 osmoprotectant ABC transporter permease OsmY [Kosakon